jgi:uncharacterized protein with HEPN domain
MSRDWIVSLEDILEAASEILRDTENITFEEFEANHQILTASLYNFIIIGEAVKNLPETLRQKYVQVEWKGVVAFRDILAHQYFRINPEIIWDTIQNKLPTLKQQIEEMIKAENDETPLT